MTETYPRGNVLLVTLAYSKQTTPQFRRRADFSPLRRNEFRPTKLFLASR